MSTSNLGDDLGPFHPLWSPSKAHFATYIDPIRKDPTGSVQRLRQLHRDTPLNEENADLIAFADKMYRAVLIMENMSRDVWLKLIRADVADVCLDILMRDDLWQSHWVCLNPFVWRCLL